MGNKNFGLHHLQKRKKVSKKLEPFPATTKLKRIFDKLIYLVAFISPLVNIPQLYKIIHEKTAAGVSLTTWGSFLLLASIWFAYGIIHKDRPITYMYLGLIITQVAIIIAIFIY